MMVLESAVSEEEVKMSLLWPGRRELTYVLTAIYISEPTSLQSTP